jgi:hypothetical protein
VSSRGLRCDAPCTNMQDASSCMRESRAKVWCVASMQVMKPKDFAQQINLNMDNCWGIVRALVDLCMKQEDGKYLLVKDPNKQLLRLYSVPEDAFQVSSNSLSQSKPGKEPIKMHCSRLHRSPALEQRRFLLQSKPVHQNMQTQTRYHKLSELGLVLQENYSEEPIAELEEVPTEEPAKADGGEED